MTSPWKLLFLCLVFRSSLTQNPPSNNCKSKQTCSECIQELGCVWCIKPQHEGHCLHELESNSRWCSKEFLTNPQSSFTILQNKDLSSDEGLAVQIKPQRVKLSLRKGQQYTLSFQYAQAKDYPVDLYYIMDLSASMEYHRAKLAKLGRKLSQTMNNITNNFQLGFGSFVDKVDLPFVSTVPSKLQKPCVLTNQDGVRVDCVSPYSFKNHMSLSENYEKFTREVSKAKISGNLDSPEGGFDAVMQAIVCRKEIGWRPQARHLLVFSTDAEFHIAGDGKLAGVIVPNDARCHMKDNSYTHDLLLDYPSVSHINHVAKENNINIMFAVVNKSRTVHSYTGLSREIENSEVGILGEKSDNVVNLVVDNYKKIVDSVKISANSSSDVEVKISSTCPYPIDSGCTNIHVGEVVHFDASIRPLQCTGATPRLISIKPEAIEESVIVELEVVCGCECESPSSEWYQPHAAECSGNGTLECGVCACDSGFFGERCECNRQHATTTDVAACRAPNETRLCSGLGVCVCGQCRCDERANADERIFGKFCDCDNYSCKRVEGRLCAGRGRCECGGRCSCDAGWTGDACQCPDGDDACVKPGEEAPCSGHGVCVCGRCRCTDEEVRYSGKYCDECPTCSGQRCDELKDCVECTVYGEGGCDVNCTFVPVVVDKIEDDQDDNTKRCTLVDSQGCTFVFQYEYGAQNELKVTAEREKFCPAPPNVMAWVLGVIGSILLAGLVLLVIWKLFTSLHDRREYAKFENERQKLRWHRNDNPLYKQATSTFSNPVYRKSRNWFKHDS